MLNWWVTEDRSPHNLLPTCLHEERLRHSWLLHPTASPERHSFDVDETAARPNQVQELSYAGEHHNRVGPQQRAVVGVTSTTLSDESRRRGLMILTLF